MQQNYVKKIDRNIRYKTLENLNLFFLFLIIAWTLTPYLIKNTSQFLVILIFLGWWISVFLIIFTKKSISISNGLLIPITISWLVIVSIYIFLQLSNFSFGNYFYIVLYYMPIFFLVFYLKYGSYLDYKKILIITFIVLFVNSIINITYLIDNPYAAKEATGGYGITDYSNSNIITDIFIFAYVLTVYGSVVVIKYFSNLRIKYFLIIYAVVATLMIIQSTFFIANISLIILLTLFILLKGGNRITTYIKYFLLSSIILLLFLFKNYFLSKIVNSIYAVTDNYIIIQRVQAIANVLIDFSLQGSLKARMGDLATSLRTFTEHPFLGKGYLLSQDIYSTGIGMHSHLLDDLARFGIFVFIIEIMVYVIFVKFINEQLESKTRKFNVISWCGFAFYALFNPIVYPPSGIVLFFIFPLFIIFFDKINKKMKEV